MKTKDLIGNVVAVSFVSLLFIFALTWIIFDFNGSSSSLKDTWSIVGSVFGGITTLAAAYIALVIYENWKVEYNKNIEKDFLMKALSSLENCHFNLIPNINELKDIVLASQQGTTIIKTTIEPCIIDINLMEITSQNIKHLQQVILREEITDFFKCYKESYELLKKQTVHFHTMYLKDIREFNSTGQSDFGSVSFFRINCQESLNPYPKKISNYKESYENLSNKLIELIKA
ncbi:hypothetical protein PX012_16770 [Acinetobacter baumannii]|uniref:hypothetical protein n=1 Tax=Acinetobacter baumannii TaxID=470 RepID=UPI00292CA2D9|nr:hypothetical protein [Acinetobacter baumannii]